MTSAKIANGTLTNTQISNSAAIAYSKLNLATSIVNGDINAGAAIAYSKLNLSNSIVNGDVAAGANIAYSKLNLAGSIVNADVSSSAAIAYSKLNLSGSITNSDVSNTASIAYSKLNLAGSIVNADVSSSAAIAYSKLNLAGSIVNSDISGSAGIAFSKLATLNTGQIVVGSSGTPTAVTLGGDATIDASGTLTIANNAITTTKIANSQVTTGKLASGAVPTVIGGASGTANVALGGTFMGPFITGIGTESAVQQRIQASGTISNLRVDVGATPASGRSWTFTVRKNGANTGVACTIDNAAGTTCTDSLNSVSVAATDQISIGITSSATAPANTFAHWTAKLSTP